MKQLNKKNGKLNNKGFSLVEIMVVVAIMSILAGVIGLSLIQYLEKARKGRLAQDAQALLDVAQIAIADASSLPSFPYAIKYKHDLGDGTSVNVARFTNQTLYQYTTGKTSHNLSAPSDMTIAAAITSSLPGAQDYYQNKNPIDNRDSTLYISKHPEEYGKFAFAFTYDSDGSIYYFEACYNGYFFKQYLGELTIEKARDDLYFEDWPIKTERIDPSW